MLRSFNLFFFSCICFIILSCHSTESKTSVFTLLSNDSTGIHFNNINAENEQINILTYEYLYNGGGVAIGDINNDGLKDIYFTSNNLENKLYLNKGNFKFEDVTAKAGVGCKPGWKTGVTMADVNGDGWLDIYVCKSADADPEKRRNILLINNGDLTFTDRSKEYGLDDPGYSTQAAFFDYDNDGDLDMFLLNHSLIEVSNTIGINPILREQRHPYYSDKLFRNDNGKFTDVSEIAGIRGGMANYGLGIAISDFNNDGWQDIYVTNDYAENDHLYINNQKGGFGDSVASYIDHMSNFSMGVDVADFNNDGLQDICTLDMLPEDNKRQKLLFGPNEYDKFNMFVKTGLQYQYMRNMLQLNDGNGRFSEIGQLAGVSNTDWSWAPLIADFDNDGLPDLFISNGYKRDFTNMDFLKYKSDMQIKKKSGAPADQQASLLEMIRKMPSNKFHNYMFKNKGDLTFANVSENWGFGSPVLDNGAAYADLDNDGDLDLVTNNIDEEAFIYRNNSNEFFKNNYLEINLKGDSLNRYGIGSKVKIYTNGQIEFQENNPTRGFQSCMNTELHFGLGSNKQVDSVEVIWQGGKRQVLKQVKANHVLQLNEKDATEKYLYEKPLVKTYFEMDEKPIIPFIHKEDDFIDFNVQSFLPGFLSTQGPRIARADVNRDGREDVYICGAKNQPGELFLQSPDGHFKKTSQPAFEKDSSSEDIDACFFDADGDGDNDLFVVSGGYVFKENSPELLTRLYLNGGKGNFSLKPGAAPNVYLNASCVKPADVDGDGDIDVFVGGRVIPGKYPETPASYLLLNDGKGNFTDKTAVLAPGLQNAGMVTDAIWVDLNNDKQKDLIVVGEWMPIKVFINEKGKLIDKTKTYFSSGTNGWWNRIYADDFDKDGDMDFIVGNRGLNTQVKVSEEQPCTMYYKDFDGNGSIDGIMCYYIQGKSYPALSRDEMVEQLPGLRKKFNDYASYSTATINDFFSGDELSSAKKLVADNMASCYIENKGNGKFEIRKLPVQAQFSPVYAISSLDVNKDGNQDLLLAGNFEKTRVSIGKFDANHGMLFLGDGKGNFRYVPQTESGLSVKGDVRDIQVINVKGKTTVLFSISDKPVASYHVW
jgi:hypothetical protein